MYSPLDLLHNKFNLELQTVQLYQDFVSIRMEYNELSVKTIGIDFTFTLSPLIIMSSSDYRLSC